MPPVPDKPAAVTDLRLVLTVDDHDRTLAFYRDQLGLEELESYDTELAGPADPDVRD